MPFCDDGACLDVFVKMPLENSNELLYSHKFVSTGKLSNFCRDTFHFVVFKLNGLNNVVIIFPIMFDTRHLINHHY